MNICSEIALSGNRIPQDANKFFIKGSKPSDIAGPITGGSRSASSGHSSKYKIIQKFTLSLYNRFF